MLQLGLLVSFVSYLVWTWVVIPATEGCFRALKPQANAISDCSTVALVNRYSGRYGIASDALVIRSVAHELRGEANLAREDFSLAVTLARGVRGPLLLRSQIDSETGNLNRALDALTGLLTVNQADYTLLVERGIVNRRLGRNSEAFADYDAAILIDPDAYDAHNNKAWALMLDDRLDEALAHVEKALVRDVVSANAHDTKANILSAKGEAAAALQEFKISLRIGGNEELARLGGLLVKKGFLVTDKEFHMEADVLRALENCTQAKCKLIEPAHDKAPS